MLRALLSMLTRPGAAFDRVLERRGGFIWLFSLLALELCLERPEAVAIAFASSPLSIGPTFLRYAIGPAVFVFGSGVALHYIARARGKNLDMEVGAALVTLAWVSHTVWVSFSVLLAHGGFEHPLMPHQPAHLLLSRGELWQVGGLVVEYAPVVLFTVIAFRHAVSDPTPRTDQGRPKWLIPSLSAVLIVLVLILNVQRVRAQWDELRPLTAGDPFPAVELVDLDGTVLQTDSLRGNVVLVDFWATWCAPCRQSLPIFAELAKRYSDRPFTLLSVNVEAQHPETVRNYLAENGLDFPVHLDGGELSERMHVEALPTAFLVDDSGVVIDRHVGVWALDSLRAHIDPLLRATEANAGGVSPSAPPIQ